MESKLNKRLLEIEKENAFSKVKRLVNEYKVSNPEAEIISLGIGDVSKPVPRPATLAMKSAIYDLQNMDNFPGYGNYYGLEKLRQIILDNDYKDFGFRLNEIYIGDGTKSDTGNILELFRRKALIGIPEFMYPIYENSCRALSRTFMYMPMSDNMKCLPDDNCDYDIVYLCSPNNPSGLAYTREELEQWRDYCQKHNTIILYDNVYEQFIQSPNCPHSIYEIEGMKNYAIEFRSFSKKASFTGLRCSYYIIPEDIEKGINAIWKERTLNRFNGASYLAQIGAIETYSDASKNIIKENIKYYINNANILKEGFTTCGFEVIGGTDAPFMLIKNNKENSWATFDWFLKELNIVVIPGIIFGKAGDDYCRISALGNTKDIMLAVKRLKEKYEK